MGWEGGWGGALRKSFLVLVSITFSVFVVFSDFCCFQCFFVVFSAFCCCFQCAYCSKEANFYCCWNTSYCNYPCQQAAWPEHMSKCTQTRAGASQPTDSSSGGISAMAGVESKPDLAARQTTISVGRPVSFATYDFLLSLIFALFIDICFCFLYIYFCNVPFVFLLFFIFFVAAPGHLKPLCYLECCYYYFIIIM